MTVWCAGLDETALQTENRNKHKRKRIVRQVGYLQRLYRNVRSTEYKITKYIDTRKKIAKRKR
jgi:IS4 transposase